MNSMLLISSRWNVDDKPVATFRMILAADSCPYQECIYDPGSKMLAVISKIPKKSYTMAHKLDGNGMRIPVLSKEKGKREVVGFKQERVLLDSYQEFYIENQGEIEDFVRMFAINSDFFDYKKYFNTVPPGEISIANPEKIEVPAE